MGTVTVLGLTLASLATPALASTVSPDSEVVGNGAWVAQGYNCDGDYTTPRQSDVFGPDRAPYGPGSHQLRLGESDQQTELYRTPAFDGTNLSDLTRLDYSTYAEYHAPGTGSTDGPLRQPAFLRLSVDDDGNGSMDTSLFFIPANNGTPANGEWQDWSTTDGEFDVNGDGGTRVSLADYAAAHSDAVIVNNDVVDGQPQPSGGGLAVVVGCGQGGSSDPQTNGYYNVDRVIVGIKDQGTTLFDFGPRAEEDGSTTNLVVDPDNAQGWASQAFDADSGDDLTSTQKFVKGPGEPPAGVGSLRFSIDDNANRVEQFRTARYDGRKLRDLRAADFSTRQEGHTGNATPQVPVYLRLNIDANADGDFEPGGADDQLYFVPGNNDTVQQGAWQRWTPVSGVWNLNGDDGQPNAISLDTYLAEHPDAVLANNGAGALGGAVDFQVGAAGDNQRNADFFLDDLNLRFVDDASGRTESGQRFDLEPRLPQVSVSDASAREANDTRVPMTFTISLDRAYDDAVTVPFHTEDGTALAGRGKDYNARNTSVTIPAGQTTAEVNVSVLGGKTYERTETMSLVLGQPSFGQLADGRGTGRITDNDTRVNLAVANAESTKIRVDLRTTPARAKNPVSVYATVNGGARRTIFSGQTNADGELHRLLSAKYRRGANLKVWAVVFNIEGDYRSGTRTIRIS